MMISSTIGLIAMTGVISMFATSVKSNGDNLKRVRLNQELRAIMDVMVRDTRRAGYWRDADGVMPNPFSTLNVSNDGSCITYSYDFTETYDFAAPSPLDDADNFGFRLLDDGVKYRKNSTTCGSTTDWELISDPNAITITGLNFTLNTTCSNLTSEINTDCMANNPAPGDILSYMYILDITLAGELSSDNTVTYSLTDSVSIRNAVPTEN